MIGNTVSHYKIIEKLGEGGMGVVYVAQDTNLARHVAIKFLSSLDRPYRSRFLREARAVSQLQNQNIATLYDYGETEDGRPFIVMELVRGKTLHELLEEHALSISESVRISASIAEALSEAHRAQIIHRDIKPSNVMINDRGQVKVLDFGLAKMLDEEATGQVTNRSQFISTQTQSNIVVGTPLYLSPEQATGKPIDGRSDLFALGAVLYECLTGQSAFSGGSALEIGAQIIHVSPPPPSSLNPDLPKELDRVVLKALEKNPKERYQTADEFLIELKQAQEMLGSRAHLTRPAAGKRDVRASALTTISETLRQPRVSIFTLTATVAIVFGLVWGVFKFWKPAPYRPSPEVLQLYNQASESLRNGAYLQATKVLQQVVATDPNFALAHARLAEGWFELDYSERAKDEMLRVSLLVRDRSSLPAIDALYLDAINATVSTEFETAVKTYSEIAKLQPNEPQVYVDLGRAYEKTENLNEAIANYLKATNLNANYATAYLRTGICYSRKAEIAAAATNFDKAEALFKTLGNVEGVTEVFRQRGILFQRGGRVEDALSQLKQAIETARATNNSSQEISVLLDMSYLSLSQGATTESQGYAQQAYTLAATNHLDNLAAGSLIELGNSYRTQGDFAEAEKYFKQAIEVARSNKGVRREATATSNLGGLYIQQLRTDEGLALVQQGFAFFEKNHYRRESLTPLIDIGRALRRKGDYEGALKACYQRLQLAQQIGEKLQVALSHGEIGSVMTEQERYPEALAEYQKSYEIERELDAQTLIAYNSHNRARILFVLGYEKEARAALAEASKIAADPKRSLKALVPEIDLTSAQIDLSQDNHGEAIKLAEKAVAESGTQYPAVMIEAKATACLAKSKAGTTRDAAALCSEAVEAAKQGSDEALLTRVLLVQAETLLLSGNSAEAHSIALQAQQRFNSKTQLESEWRAWLIAALASKRNGDNASWMAEKAKAVETLQRLHDQWGNDSFASYINRKDVQLYRNQLG